MASHPAAKTAMTRVATEITSVGAFGLLDRSLDYVAYKIAYHMVQEELKVQNKKR